MKASNQWRNNLATLYNKKGQKVEIPDDQVAAALRSGQYGLYEQTVRMVGPDGEVLEGPAAKTADMYDRGFRLESEQEATTRKLQEQYGGTLGEAAAFAHGAVSAPLFGAPDVVGRILGGREYTEIVNKLREANPTAEMAGSIAGITGAMFMPGGQAKAAQGLGKLAAPVKGVAKLGKAVEQATLKALGGPQGGLVRQALAKGASMGLGAGVEGAIYGAGEFASEVALGNEEMTAENLLAHGKTGFLWGGAAGGALGASGPLISKIVGTGKAFAKNSAKSLVSQWEKATGRKAVKGVADELEQVIKPGKIAEAQASFLGVDKEGLAKLQASGKAGREYRAKAVSARNQRDDFVRELSDLKDEIDSSYELFADEVMGEKKFKNMSKIAEVGNNVEAATEAMGIVDNLEQQLDEMFELAKTKQLAPKGAIREARDLIKVHKKSLQEALATGGDNVTEEIHHIVDRTKRDFGKIRKQLQRTNVKKYGHQKTMGRLEEMFEQMQKHLEKESLYGAVGRAQADINPIWSKIISADPLEQSFRKKVANVAWQDVFETDRQFMTKVVDSIGKPGNEIYEKHLAQSLQDKLEFINRVEKHLDLPEKFAKEAAKQKSNINKMLEALDKTNSVVGAQNQLADIISHSSALGSLMRMGAGAGLGYAIDKEQGALIGGGAGLMLSVLTNPGRTAQVRAALERITSDVDLQIGKSIKSYINKAIGKAVEKAPKAKRLVGPLSQRVLMDSNWGDKRTKDKDRQQAFERRVSELQEFVTRPQLAADRLVKNTEAIAEVAPKTAAIAQIKALNAAAYLYDKAPKAMKGQALIAKKYKVPEFELMKYERIVEAVQDPMVIMRDLYNGKLTNDVVDAVATVYPQLYQRIVLTIAEQIPTIQEKLPYKERVNLSTLFNLPVDETMEPAFYRTMQGINQQVALASPEPQQKSKLSKPWGTMKAAQAAMTDTQRIQAESA